jgi:hypothetical protein
MDAAEITEKIYRAVLSCPHEITNDFVTLTPDTRAADSHNAHKQLHNRIKDAVSAALAPVSGPCDL